MVVHGPCCIIIAWPVLHHHHPHRPCLICATILATVAIAIAIAFTISIAIAVIFVVTSTG